MLAAGKGPELSVHACLHRKSINKSGPGFGYGFIMAWTFVMFFYCLLCGLVLDSFSTTVSADLESRESVIAYMSTVCYI
jgi:hypothetical protein